MVTQRTAMSNYSDDNTFTIAAAIGLAFSGIIVHLECGDAKTLYLMVKAHSKSAGRSYTLLDDLVSKKNWSSLHFRSSHKIHFSKIGTPLKKVQSKKGGVVMSFMWLRWDTHRREQKWFHSLWCGPGQCPCHRIRKPREGNGKWPVWFDGLAQGNSQWQGGC